MCGKESMEMWDVYTKDRVKTGRLHRRGEKMAPGDFHLVTGVCIFNKKGEVLLQQRQPFKYGYPNMWDISACGSALAGESSSMAAERELAEEIGLQLDLSEELPFFSVYRVDAFCDFYFLQREVDTEALTLQEEEVRQVRWVSVKEMLQMQEDGVMVSRWFLPQMEEIQRIVRSRLGWDEEIIIKNAERKNLNGWMNFVEIVRWNFPGLETEELLEKYRETVEKNIDRGTAVCALAGRMVVGVLLFSVKHNRLNFLAVHPEFRRRGIGAGLVRLAFERLDLTKDIVVDTFCEEDEKGAAPRAFYQKLGFSAGEIKTIQMGGKEHPVQSFIKLPDCTCER